MNQQVDQRAQDLRRRDDSAHAAAGPVLVTAGDAASLPPRRWDAIKGDLAGGATSGIVALPQTITIGALAFAPLGPGYVTYGILAGFYCSIVSGLLVALCGGTRFGVGGPRSSFSLVMALILSALLAHETGLAGAGVARVLVLTFLAVSLAGLLQIAFGAIGAGSYIKFIPHPVVAGFMNGLALLILVSQLPALAGIARDTRWWDFQTILDQLQFATAAVALMTFLIMSSVGRTWPRLPAALIAVAGGTAFYYALSYYPAASRFGVPHLGALVGTIPASFPAPAFLGKFVAAAGEKQTWYLLWQIAPSIAVLALLGALESLMCAVAVGQLSGRRPEANRELIAQGVSNLAGGVFGAVFGGSTSSRTMLNYRAGGRGRLSGVTHAGVMLLALMTAQFWVAHLPQVVLAAVLTTIALGMFDGWTRDII